LDTYKCYRRDELGNLETLMKSVEAEKTASEAAERLAEAIEEQETASGPKTA